MPVVSDAFGISGGGRSAEEAFREYTGATKPQRASAGDAILEGHPVEVKRVASATLNQVRAVKYIPLVAYHEPSDSWYVIPAHAVVAAVSGKRRGQHTENPFESTTLSIHSLDQFRVDDPGELRSRTMDAIEASSRYLELKQEMQRVLQESRRLADDSIERVKALLAGLGLDTPARGRRRTRQ
jgi:hypothetical protein